MVKTLYHGSECVIKSPQFGVGKTDNDYGHGFYCTERLELAWEWAVADLHDGHANRYTLDFEGLTAFTEARARSGGTKRLFRFAA